MLMETIEMIMYGCIFLLGFIVGRLVMAVQYSVMSVKTSVKPKQES
jgi:hypothetical protein